MMRQLQNSLSVIERDHVALLVMDFEFWSGKIIGNEAAEVWVGNLVSPTKLLQKLNSNLGRKCPGVSDSQSLQLLGPLPVRVLSPEHSEGLPDGSGLRLA